MTKRIAATLAVIPGSLFDAGFLLHCERRGRDAWPDR